MTSLDSLRNWVQSTQRIVFFGGAGVSTESGIPDFRSQDGLYHQKYDFPPETILSASFFQQQPEEFFRFYRDKMLPIETQPNAAHKTLARWEKEGRLAAIITQNIDGLHQKAGSQHVFELHGSIWRNHCLRCGKTYGPEFIRDHPGIPHCSCGGFLKPDVVLYEESLDNDCLEGAIQALQNADLLIVGGTSLTVYPAAGLLRYYHGEKLVLINRDETPYDRHADLILRDPIGQIFAQL